MTREDIEKASLDYQTSRYSSVFEGMADIIYKAKINADFIAGAEWVLKNILKPADGEDLPEYDKGVIVLKQPYPLEVSEFAVSFAHRPDPKGWNGKSITTGKVEHYTPKTYGKGGWNIPDVKYWLDIELPGETELEQKENKL